MERHVAGKGLPEIVDACSWGVFVGVDAIG